VTRTGRAALGGRFVGIVALSASCRSGVPRGTQASLYCTGYVLHRPFQLAFVGRFHSGLKRSSPAVGGTSRLDPLERREEPAECADLFRLGSEERTAELTERLGGCPACRDKREGAPVLYFGPSGTAFPLDGRCSRICYVVPEDLRSFIPRK
jgi:hypothetical protein